MLARYFYFCCISPPHSSHHSVAGEPLLPRHSYLVWSQPQCHQSVTYPLAKTLLKRHNVSCPASHSCLDGTQPRSQALAEQSMTKIDMRNSITQSVPVNHQIVPFIPRSSKVMTPSRQAVSPLAGSGVCLSGLSGCPKYRRLIKYISCQENGIVQK